MIRQAAFENAGPFLKGGLHCHTTRSDGEGSPEAVMQYHKENGYDFLAITDHRKYNFQSFAPETGLLILPGMEFDNTFERTNGFRCFHTVVLGRRKEEGNPYEQDQTFDSGKAGNQEEYQTYLDEFHRNGQLTTLCHPEWSSTPARYFEKLQGNFAMEIWNSGCAVDCGCDRHAAYWDELLEQGIRIYGIATDDGHAMYHHCKGWVMVKAEKNVDSVLQALREGAFYSSCGPEIRDFYVDDDGIAHVSCSPVSEIILNGARHPARLVKGEALTEATFDTVKRWPGPYDYIRLTLTDAEGNQAWTNPIFLDRG